MRSLSDPRRRQEVAGPGRRKSNAGPDAPRFISGGTSLGALTLFDGLRCRRQFVGRGNAQEGSKFNDAVQAWMFNPDALAPTFRKARLQNRFRSTPITISMMRPRSTARRGSSRCASVENKNRGRWKSSINCRRSSRSPAISASRAGARSGSWTGTPLRDFLKIVGADTRAKYVWFQCADKDGYNSPLDMRTALHPQTQMTFKFGDAICHAPTAFR